MSVVLVGLDPTYPGGQILSGDGRNFQILNSQPSGLSQSSIVVTALSGSILAGLLGISPGSNGGVVSFNPSTNAFRANYFSSPGGSIAINFPASGNSNVTFDVQNNTTNQNVNVQVGSGSIIPTGTIKFVPQNGLSITTASSGNVLTLNMGLSGSSIGTVTSVGLQNSSDNIFSISGSPVTTSGAFTLGIAQGALPITKLAPASTGTYQLISTNGTVSWNNPITVSTVTLTSSDFAINPTTPQSGNVIISVNLPSGGLPLADLAQGGATSGQVIAWNGTAWAPATVGGAVSSVSNSDGSLTISPTTGSVVASLASAIPQVHTFTSGLYFGATAPAAPGSGLFSLYASSATISGVSQSGIPTLKSAAFNAGNVVYPMLANALVGGAGQMPVTNTDGTFGLASGPAGNENPGVFTVNGAHTGFGWMVTTDGNPSTGASQPGMVFGLTGTSGAGTMAWSGAQSGGAAPSNGQVLSWNSTAGTFQWINASGSGTVTSVGLQNDSNGIFQISGSPITNSGSFLLGIKNNAILPAMIQSNGVTAGSIFTTAAGTSATGAWSTTLAGAYTFTGSLVTFSNAISCDNITTTSSTNGITTSVNSTSNIAGLSVGNGGFVSNAVSVGFQNESNQTKIMAIGCGASGVGGLGTVFDSAGLVAFELDNPNNYGKVYDSHFNTPPGLSATKPTLGSTFTAPQSNETYRVTGGTTLVHLPTSPGLGDQIEFVGVQATQWTVAGNALSNTMIINGITDITSVTNQANNGWFTVKFVCVDDSGSPNQWVLTDLSTPISYT